MKHYHRMAGMAALMTVVSPAQTVSAQSAVVPISVTTTPLADGIYLFTAAGVNSVAIITDRDVLVFDTTHRPLAAATILAELQKLTSKPVRYVVNSHWHRDHWSGNQVFAAAYPGLEIIATEQERDFMMNVASGWARSRPRILASQEKALADRLASGVSAPGVPLTREQRAADELQLLRVRDMIVEQAALIRTYPTLTYTDQLTLYHGGREFRFMSVTGDAAGTTVLFLPKEKILITGDVVSYPLPFFTPPLSEHSRSIRVLSRLDADIIVPGHGPAFRDKSYMLLEAELFDEVRRQVVAALRQGMESIDEVQAAVNFDRFAEPFAQGDHDVAAQFVDFMKKMVRRAYIESHDGKEIEPTP